MADTNSNKGTSSSGHTPETSGAYVELNIKTLDSQVHSFRVGKNTSVSSFKEQIASAVGVPAVQQRLIFRGKVLKDDHLLSDYNVEDGHTLHLVERQPVQSQSPAGTGSATTSSHNVDQSGSEPTAGGSRTRAGQVSHSVVLGTFNIGDQVEDIVPDISRIIGAVLNSVGLGSLSGANGASSNQLSNSNAPDRGTQGRENDGSRAPGRGREETANQIPHGPTPPNTASQSLPQFRQLLSGVAAVPSQSLVIPDSLTTLSEFISQMELMLSSYGNNNQSTSSVSRGSTQPSDNSSSHSRGLPTPESLSSVIRRVQQLLGGHAGSALSHFAGRIEGQSGVTDPTVRNQIQAEAIHLGIAMQHLGSLFLELGRTTQMLRLGPSPADSVVNSGPAVYISRHGPNPLMVQPLPFQPTPLFGTNSVIPVQLPAASSGQLTPVDISRNINIHIHAGTSAAQGLSSAGARAAGEVSNMQTQNAEQANTTPANSTEHRDPGPARLLPTRTVVAAMPSRLAEATNHVLSLFYPMHARSQQSSVPQQATVNSTAPAQGPSATVSVGAGFGTSTGSSQQPTVTSQAEMHVRGVEGDPTPESHSGGSTSATANVAWSARTPQSQDVVNSVDQTAARLKPGSLEHVLESCVTTRGHVEVPTVNQFNNSDNVDRRTNPTFAASTDRPEESTYFSTAEEKSRENPDGEMGRNVSVPTSDHSRDTSREKAVPLGLGLGALQPLPSKRKIKPLKQQKVEGQTGDSASISHTQDAISRGQSILQSLVSQGQSGTARADANVSSLQPPSLVGQFDKMSSEHVPGTGKVDVTSMLSHVLNDPTFNNLLSGISSQAEGVHPDVFRNVLGRFASSPSVRSAFEQVVQQVEDQDVEKTFSGLGTGQGIDFSRMFQQMLPVVTKALGGMSASSAPRHEAHDSSTGFQTAVEDCLPHVMEHNVDDSQIDMQDTARLIESHGSPVAVFRAMVNNAGRLSGIGVDSGLIDELCTDELADEYMQMFHRDLHRRFDPEGRSEDRP